MTTEAEKPQHDWLAMIFLGGDNDLFQFGRDLLTEAQRVGSTSRVAVVAQHDPTDPDQPTLRGPILRGRWNWENIGRTDGDAKAIVDFVRYAKKEFEAEKKLLIMWDHGNGWQNVHAFQHVAALPAPLPIEDVGKAVQDSGISVLCFDACLMAMIEVAYQLRDRVQYIVASENVVPADSGWPYDTILRMLTVRPEIEPEQVVCALVDGFSGAYNGSDEPITLSALKLEHVGEAVQAIDHLSRQLIAACQNGIKQNVRKARRYSQSFGNPDYIDLVSFCEELELQLPCTPIAAAAESVRKAVAKLVIRVTRGSARSISGAHGVSIYFPDRPLSPEYQKLDFANAGTCMWANFLAMLAPQIEPVKPLELPKADESHACPRDHITVCPECSRIAGAGLALTQARRRPGAPPTGRRSATSGQ